MKCATMVKLRLVLYAVSIRERKIFLGSCTAALGQARVTGFP